MGSAADELAVHPRLMIGIIGSDLTVGTNHRQPRMQEVQFPHPLLRAMSDATHIHNTTHH